MRIIANGMIILSAVGVLACDSDNLSVIGETETAHDTVPTIAADPPTEWNSNFCGDYLNWNTMVPHQLVSNNPSQLSLRAYATEEDAIEQSLIPQDALIGLTRASTPTIYLRESVDAIETGTVLPINVPIWMPIRLADPSSQNQWVDLNLDKDRARFRQAGGQTFKAFDGTLNTFSPAGGNTNGGLDNFRCITAIPTQQGDLPGNTPPTTGTTGNGFSLVFVKLYVYRGQNDWSDFFSRI